MSSMGQFFTKIVVDLPTDFINGMSVTFHDQSLWHLALIRHGNLNYDVNHERQQEGERNAHLWNLEMMTSCYRVKLSFFVLLRRTRKKSIIESALTARAWDYPLAQSAERWTPLPEAPGSNPRRGYVTIFVHCHFRFKHVREQRCAVNYLCNRHA